MLRPGAERDRDRMDFPGAIALGRCLQRRDETPDADSRFQIRRQRDLFRWLNQSALAKSRREDWRRTRRYEDRSARPREFYLQNHALGLFSTISNTFRQNIRMSTWTQSVPPAVAGGCSRLPTRPLPRTVLTVSKRDAYSAWAQPAPPATAR